MEEVVSHDLASIHTGLEKVFEVSTLLDFPFTFDEVATYFFPRLRITGPQLRQLLSEENFADIPFQIQDDFLLTSTNQSQSVCGERELTSSAKLQSATKFARTLTGMVPFIRTIAVTGSVAYGSAGKWDDIDLFVVTERNRLWLSIFAALLLVRLGKMLGLRPAHLLPFCLSYVHDEYGFAHDSSRNRVNPLFARELLKARPVFGSSEYRGLLKRNAWVGRMYEKPYLAKIRKLDSRGQQQDSRVGNRGIFSVVLDWVEGVLFVFLGNYLHLRAYLTNLKLRSDNQYLRVFEPRITQRSCVYTSNFYRWLLALWGDAP